MTMYASGRGSGRSPRLVGVLLSYNSVDTLLPTLAAVRSQRTPLDRLVIVDNGSTDGSPEWIKEVADIAVLLPDNRGVGAGHNAGWRTVLREYPSAEFIWALEHDSEPEDDCLALLLEACIKHGAESRVGAIVPLQRLPGELSPHRSLPPYAAPKMTFNATLLPVDAVSQMGFLREDFFVGQEDREYAWRLSRAGYRIVHVPAASVVHRNKGMRRRYQARSIARDYYSARNELYVRRRVREEPFALLRLMFRGLLHMARVSVRGKNKQARRQARLMALRDGVRDDLGKKHYAFLEL